MTTSAMLQELTAAALVGGAFLAIFGAAELWRRTSAPPPEYTRKLVHFAAGVVVALFPWIFRSHWTVLALSVAFAALIGSSRRLGLLASVHGVERRSGGAVYYPVAVYLLFLPGHTRPALYLIAVLTLVVSDTLAALLGSTYGRRTYEVESDRKSLEGSAVFFLATFLVVHVPLLLLTGAGGAASLLIALQVALLATFLEAVSIRGSDNLIVPLATFYLLLKMTPKPVHWTALTLAAQVGILAFVGLIAWRTRCLTFGGAIAAHLALYASLTLGGPAWLLPMLLAFAGLLLLRAGVATTDGETPDGKLQISHRDGVLAVLYGALVPLLLLFASNTASTLYPMPALFARSNPFFVPFTAALAAQLALLGADRFPGRAPLVAMLVFALIAPASLWPGTGRLSAPDLACVAAVIAISTLWNAVLLRISSARREPLRGPRLRSASVALATAVALPVYLRFLGVL